MFFQTPTRTLPNRLITLHCLRYQLVLTEPFAVPDIEALGMVLLRVSVLPFYQNSCRVCGVARAEIGQL
jgi:hypothetical protein